jgi:SAM-dependent methyltransferase
MAYLYEENCVGMMSYGALPLHTPDEPWYETRAGSEAGHVYCAAVDFAVASLGSSAGKCLVVGSPLFEVTELMAMGWNVTFLDVRKPPNGVPWVHGNACAMPFEDESFDAVSSSCVMCHVGIGRYDDPKCTQGDLKMMRELYRVLKPGGLCALTIGPISNIETTIRLVTMHRVYSFRNALGMAHESGFEVERTRIWNTADSMWREIGEPITDSVNEPDHLMMLMRKSEAMT